MLQGGQESLCLRLGAEASHDGQEQGGRVQAAGGQDLVTQQQVRQVIVYRGDLVAHDEGMAPWVWDSRVSEGFRYPSSSVIVLLACLVVVVDKDDAFSVKVLHAIIHHVHEGCLPLVLHT